MGLARVEGGHSGDPRDRPCLPPARAGYVVFRAMGKAGESPEPFMVKG